MYCPKRDTTLATMAIFIPLSAAGITRNCVLLCAASLDRVEATRRHVRGR